MKAVKSAGRARWRTGSPLGRRTSEPADATDATGIRSGTNGRMEAWYQRAVAGAIKTPFLFAFLRAFAFSSETRPLEFSSVPSRSIGYEPLPHAGFRIRNANICGRWGTPGGV